MELINDLKEGIPLLKATKYMKQRVIRGQPVRNKDRLWGLGEKK